MRNRNFFNGDYQGYMEHKQRNRRFFGILVAVLGVLFLLKTVGLLSYYSISLTWPVILIIIGAFIGMKNRFRNHAWWILIFIGVANLVPEFTFMGRPSTHFVWPVALIIGGLFIAFRPRKYNHCYPGTVASSTVTSDGRIDIDVAFGGKKELITSRDFQGGTVDVTFAGCELNLSQADMTQPSVVLDLRVSFGCVEMVVPSNWEIQNEISPSFGSVEDERVIKTGSGYEQKKILILRGSVSFGSIEIKSY